jgi:hypothetical protein
MLGGRALPSSSTDLGLRRDCAGTPYAEARDTLRHALSEDDVHVCKYRADSPGATISAPAPRALNADPCPGGLVAIDVQWEDRAEQLAVVPQVALGATRLEDQHALLDGGLAVGAHDFLGFYATGDREAGRDRPLEVGHCRR